LVLQLNIYILFHLQGLSVRDMNFVHWLSSFHYPDRTTATLLDQMDHPFGCTLRPANKTMYNTCLSMWLAYSLGWRPVLSRKRRCLIQLSICIFVCGKLA